MRERTITVDINKNYHKSLNYKQYDNNNVLNIIIKEDDNLVDITNYTARAFYQLPSKTVIQRNTTKNGKNTIKLKIDKVILAESGRISLEVVINNVDTVVTTFTLFIDVEKSIDRNEAIEGYPEWDIIADGLSHLEDVENRMSIAENEIVDIESEVSTVKNRVSTVEGEVADIKNEVTDARNGETSLKARLDRDIQNTEEKLNTTKNELNTTKNEVIDARDGETSLKARLDRDIEKAKQVYVNVEGSHISTDSSVGYAKDVEILGNTIQDASNLADIRSVGDKVEGQELYKIDVVSRGKNLFNPKIYEKFNNYTYIKNEVNFGKTLQAYAPIRLILKVKPNTDYVFSSTISHNLTRQVSTYNLPTDTPVDVAITTNGDGLVKFNSLNNNELIVSLYSAKLIESNSDIIASNFQLEEGTVATPYEPYIEDKLTILSPVQLERVGDVADRIIEKDGVWGVEKNVHCIEGVLSEFKNNNNHSYKYNVNLALKSKSAWDKPSNYTLIVGTEGIVEKNTFDEIKLQEELKGFYVETDSTAISITNGLYKSVSDKSTKFEFRCLLQQPQFIPLPHDQQIKLRTFASKTNISFLTEIEGTIKAQVPKSIGATVNTHTEQINNLNKELDRVKKLEESTVSTVTTESDFTTVEATSNGYFEDVKLEGKTLVNLLGDNGYIENVANEIYYTPLIDESVFKQGVEYTLILLNTNTKIKKVYMGNGSNTALVQLQTANNTGMYKFVYNYAVPNNRCHVYVYTTKDNLLTDEEKSNINFMVLEGDHTQNPPSFLEGLKSVGQSASGDGVDEIVVSSVNENLFNSDGLTYSRIGSLDIGKYYNEVYLKSNNEQNRVIGLPVRLPQNSNLKFYFKCEGYQIAHAFFDENLRFVRDYSWHSNDIEISPRDKEVYVAAYIKRDDGTIMSQSDIDYIKRNAIIVAIDSFENISYTPHQSDKKRLLYYNNETQAWEKPILREWDSIEKHADGKYYYHQRSGEVVLNGSEDWNRGAELTNTTKYETLDFNNKIKPYNYINDIQPLCCDKFIVTSDYINSNIDCESIGQTVSPYNTISIRISNTKLSSNNVEGFKQWLQANNVTVVYQLAEEKVYECTNIDLITYANETNYVVESGAIVPRTTLKVMSNISNTVRELQRKVSTLESYIQYVMIDALNNALNE